MNKHYLIVTQPDVSDPLYLEYEEVHSPDCPTEQVVSTFFPSKSYTRYTCSIGEYIDNWEFIDIEDDLRFKTPGKYELHIYMYNSHSLYEDSEVYIYLEDIK